MSVNSSWSEAVVGHTSFVSVLLLLFTFQHSLSTFSCPSVGQEEMDHVVVGEAEQWSPEMYGLILLCRAYIDECLFHTLGKSIL